MGFFSSRRAALAEAVAQAVAKALEPLLLSAQKPRLTDTADAAEKIIGSMGNFLSGASELALKGAASALGQRGGKRAQALRKNRQALQRGSDCELCNDPTSRNISVQTIQRHREHETSRRPNPAQQPESEANPTGQNGSGQLYGAQAIGFKEPLN